MSWILPTLLLLFAGAGALLRLAALVRRPPGVPRLIVEAFAVTVEVSALV